MIVHVDEFICGLRAGEESSRTRNKMEKNLVEMFVEEVTTKKRIFAPIAELIKKKRICDVEISLSNDNNEKRALIFVPKQCLTVTNTEVKLELSEFDKDGNHFLSDADLDLHLLKRTADEKAYRWRVNDTCIAKSRDGEVHGIFLMAKDDVEYEKTYKLHEHFIGNDVSKEALLNEKSPVELENLTYSSGTPLLPGDLMTHANTCLAALEEQEIRSIHSNSNDEVQVTTETILSLKQVKDLQLKLKKMHKELVKTITNINAGNMKVKRSTKGKMTFIISSEGDLVSKYSLFKSCSFLTFVAFNSPLSCLHLAFILPSSSLFFL